MADDIFLIEKKVKINSLVIAKLFDPYGSATRFLPENNPAEKIVFGVVTEMTAIELGYISLTEMEFIERLRIGSERDLYFQQKRLSDMKK